MTIGVEQDEVQAESASPIVDSYKPAKFWRACHSSKESTRNSETRKFDYYKNTTQAPSCNVAYTKKYPQVAKKRIPFCFCNFNHRMEIVMEVI